MKNMNMTLAFADIVADPKAESLSLVDFNKVFHIYEEGQERKIASLSMAIFISAIQSKDKDVLSDLNPDEIMVFNNKYEIKIRLTETNSDCFMDLNCFEIEPSKTSISKGLCKEVFNFTKLFVFKDVYLPAKQEKEQFVVKLLIRRFNNQCSNDEGWVIQTICPLEFDNL